MFSIFIFVIIFYYICYVFSVYMYATAHKWRSGLTVRFGFLLISRAFQILNSDHQTLPKTPLPTVPDSFMPTQYELKLSKRMEPQLDVPGLVQVHGRPASF